MNKKKILFPSTLVSSANSKIAQLGKKYDAKLTGVGCLKKSPGSSGNRALKLIATAFFLSIVMVIFISFGNIMAADKTIENEYPFFPGEKLTFKLRWGFIPAGKAVLEVFPIETINGAEAYHFVMTAKTNAFIDTFYKVRDRIDAYVDLSMTHTVFYKKNQNEGKTKKDIVVYFNWEKNEAQYSNFGKKREPISILPGSFDPLSIFYYLRLLEIKENTEIVQPVTDGKKNLLGKAKTIRKETIKVGEEIFDTFLMEPDLKDIGGVFRKSKNAKLKIWVTADNRRLLVKLKSKVIIGSFVCELISIQDSSFK